MIRVEQCLFKDMGHLTNMEIATQEFPYMQDEVKPYVMDKVKDAFIAKVGARVVGYILVTYEKDIALVDSIGVHPNFRKVGVSRKLFAHLWAKAYSNGISTIQILVADYLIEDKEDPWNLEEWLWKLGFKAVGVKSAEWYRYGRHTDVYIFERLK